MSIGNKIAQYREYRSGVKHCTFNPDGPGVVRIHLIPPKFSLFHNPRYLVILNGYYILPLGYSWAILLSAFMREVDRYDGQPIDEAAKQGIRANAVKSTLRAFPMLGKADVLDDLDAMLSVLFAVARGKSPDVEIEKLSLREYRANMTAPHRMDLMVSAMTAPTGEWKCNQKCLFCYAAGQRYGETKELTAEEWKTAIDKLRRAGVPMLTFTGGEPTMRSDIAELIDHAKWFVTRLNTNGVRLTPQLAESLRKASLDSIQITLYSAAEDIHNELVGAKNYNLTVEGIKNAVAAGLDVSVNTPICQRNADYTATLKFVHELGVRFVTCSGLICTGTAEENHDKYDLTSDALLECLRSATAYCAETQMEINFTSPGLIDSATLEELSLQVPACGAALSNMAIAPDGTVVPCQSWLAGDAGLGNILTDSFDTIWAKPLCEKLRAVSDEDAKCCPFRTGKFGD